MFSAKAGSSACVRNGQRIYQLGGFFYPVILGKLPYFFISSRSLKPSGPGAKEVKGLKQGRFQKESDFWRNTCWISRHETLSHDDIARSDSSDRPPGLWRSGLNWY